MNLAHRLDTLSAALVNLEADVQAEPATRELVTLIRASSEFHNMTALAEAAQQAELSESKDFPDRLRTLISILRQEISEQTPTATTVMIVSPDKPLVTELRSALKARGYPVVITETPEEAQQALSTQTIGACIIDLALAKADGRNLITDLRSKPETAALQIVAIGSPLTPGGIDKWPLSDADDFFQKPVKTSDIINFLNLKLKRGPARRREARRDPTTGTPNRAACHEAYSQIQKSCSDSDPIAFALFGIHRFNVLVRNVGPVGREDLIRQVASLLSASFRSSDIVARWGLFEFAVIMPGEDHYGATKAIKKILPSLNSQSVTTPAGKKLPITLCAGLTLVNNQTPLEDAAATAECHLYMAFHHAWHNPRKHWLVSDAIQIHRRSETIALFLTDSTLAKTLQQMLERETFTVDLFTSSTALTSALVQQPFNLLITDNRFPESGGFQTLNQIKTLPIQRQLRTIMIVEDEAGIERSLKMGAHDYAIKPLSIPRFRSQVHRVLWQREDSRSNTRMTIMVVDHEIPQLLIAGTALHQLGECQILLSLGPQDALGRLEHVRPHYLVLDTAMPEMTGEDFLKAIPDLNGLKGMEIIMATPPATTLPAPITAHNVLGIVSRPYQPVKFIKEIRTLIPVLQDETLPMPSVDPAPLEAEVQRILTLQDAHP